MANYTFEHSTAEHPGLCLIQNGSEIFPIFDLIEICNEAVDLIDSNSKFYNHITAGFDNIDDLNNLIRLRNTHVEYQRTALFLKLRNKGARVYIPDNKYFMDKFEYMMNSTTPNSPERERQTKILANEFYKVLALSVNKNRTTGQKLGLC